MLPPMLPKVAGKCDKCGGMLVQRPDDAEEVIRNRLDVYKRQSAPVIEFFKSKGIQFVDVHVVRGPDVMFGKIIDMLKERKFIE
jgi:adenylate kinase